MNDMKSIRFPPPVADDMVRAILDGRKTVTRRVVKPQPLSKIAYACMGYKHGTWGYPHKDAWKYWDDDSFRLPDNFPDSEKDKRWTLPCHTDDILYVQETFCKEDGKYYYRADFDSDYLDPCETLSGGYPFACRYRDCNFCDAPAQRIIWHPSIHMSREAARLFLRVTDVRVERLQKMTEEQAIKEGVYRSREDYGIAIYTFSDIWDSTIKPAGRALYGWAANPWVWVIEFEQCGKPETEPPDGDAHNG